MMERKYDHHDREGFIAPFSEPLYDALFQETLGEEGY